MKFGREKFGERPSLAPLTPEVADKKNCPTAEILLLFHRTKLSPKESKEIRDHIARCKTCAVDSTYIKNILEDENRLVQEIRDLIPRNKKNPISGRRLPLMKSLLFKYRYVAALAIFLLVMISLILRLVPARHSLQAKRNLSPMENIEMAYGLTPPTRLFQKWNGFPDTRYIAREMIYPHEDVRGNTVNIESFSLFSPPFPSAGFGKERGRIIVSVFYESRRIKSSFPEFTLK